MIVHFTLLWQKMAVGVVETAFFLVDSSTIRVVETAFFLVDSRTIPKYFKIRACYLYFSSYLCSPFCARSVKSPEKQA
jgi:hypothetical protein